MVAQKALLVTLFFLATVVSLEAQGRRPAGLSQFEEAYRIEKNEPARAAELYEEALARGLTPDLRRAADWRLYYLYRDQREFGRAYVVAGRLPSSGKLQGELVEELRRAWQIPVEAARYYLNGLTMLSRNQNDQAATAFRQAQQASPSKEKFHNEILRQLIDSDNRPAIHAFLQRLPSESVADILQRADLMLQLDLYRETDAMLFELARSGNALDPQQKGELLYLLGRIRRDQGQATESVKFFRLAARYGPVNERERNLALASFSLYRIDYPLQAEALLDGVAIPEQGNMRLYFLVVRADLRRDRAALRELQSQRSDLELLAREGSFLATRAIEVLRR